MIGISRGLALGVAVSVATALSGCGGGGSDDTISGPLTRASRYEVEVNYQKSFYVAPEAMNVVLVAIRDSRCRVDVQCVQPGSAELDVQVTLPGVVPEVKVLTLAAPEPKVAPVAVQFRGYRFSVAALQPEIVRSTTLATDYKAVIAIERVTP